MGNRGVRMNRIGIIDMGSNSSRLVIYDIHRNGSYRVSYRMKKNIQLAKYIADGRLSQEGIRIATVSARAFRNVGRLYHVQAWIAVATAAMRQAENGRDVLDLLHEETRIQFRLLTGEQEAWYGYLGVINTMDIEDAVLVDIGGASTEVTLVRDRELVKSVSLPYGALTLAKKFHHVEPALQSDAVFQFMSEELSKLDWLRAISDLPLVGIGGTMRAIGKISSKMQGHVLSRLHGYELESSVMKQIYEKMKNLTVGRRKKLGGLSDSRAEVIHAGVAVAWALTSITSATRLLISGSGLRDGLFYEYLLCGQPAPVLPSVKEHSLHNFIQLYDVNLAAAYESAECAEKLFDDLAPIHRLSEDHKRLLRISVLVYMTGAFVNVEKCAKHTDYLIRSSHLYGLTQEEIHTVSSVVLGKGPKSAKQLHLILQLANFLVHDAGLRYDDVLNAMNHKLTTTSSGKALKDLDADFKSILKGFKKHFPLS
jgi:exopolyphosphatase/guanosine-5'-triphosphate,3'-diphosphate pyrophosphatase